MEPRYNDIPDVTMKILCPGKSCSKMYVIEPRYNDLRYNNNLDIMMSIWSTEPKIVFNILILLIYSLQSANTKYQQQRFIELQ